MSNANASSIFVVGVFALGSACGPSKVNEHGVDGGGGGGRGGLTIDAPSCATSVVTAEQVALDLYVMLDQSASMSDTVSGGGTKWSAVTAAITTFLGQSGLAGVSVGLQYFGLPASGGGFNDSCTASDYAHAAVEIAPLPGVNAAITSSLAQHSPSTSTPTSAALQGAVDHAKTWAQAHTMDAVAVILATDGDPTECDTTISDIEAIASTAANGTPKIPTFVIGVGSSLSNLNGIAMAGSSMNAFVVDTNSNVNQQFLDAMNAIRHAALGCVYSIPTGSGPVDYNQVNIVYQPGNGGQPITLPYVTSKANCPANGNGWYYDNPAAPTQIILCESSCSGIEVDMTGQVDITLGCETVVQ